MKFLYIPFKPQIGKFLKKIIPQKIVVPIMQGRLKGKKWIIGSGNLEYVLGTYEFEKVKLFEKIVKNCKVIYDIGAHVGFYTLLSSELIKEKGKVVAFEPLPRNLKYLKKHLEMNNCNNVMLIEAAVSDKCSMSFFNEGPSSYTGNLSEEGKLQVNTFSIDELIKSDRIPPPNCMKIDVEGSELLVLKGAKLTISIYNPTIFLATHNHRLRIDCIKFLVSLGYKLKPIADNNLYVTREIFAYKAI